MRRRFIDAHRLLRYLIARHEAGVRAPMAYPDYQGFPSVPAADTFAKELARAARSGAIAIVNGKGAQHDQIRYVKLVSAEALNQYLKREPSPSKAQQAGARAVEDLKLDPGLKVAVERIVDKWGRGGPWNGMEPEDADKLRWALMLAQAILDRKADPNHRHLTIDYQSFSEQVTRNTKTLKKLEGAVVSLLRKVLDLPAEATPREALRTLGLGRFAPALLIAGPVNLDGTDFTQTQLRYLGLPPEEVHCLRFQTAPAYLLTIENFASFNRHLIEADRERLGVTIYVGGYPALATKEALRRLVEIAPADTPIYHWSDIDPDGTWIFRTIESAIGRPLRPHLMSPDLAEARGTVPTKKKSLGSCPASSAIAPLVEYLRREDAKTLEQEALTPCRPELAPNQPARREPARCERAAMTSA
jgi:Uncharacterized protein conserved in bacteria C-term(DUF2220)